MGIREQLNEKPALGIGLGAGVIVLALVFVAYEMMPSKALTDDTVQAYFSDDDGATYFTAPATNLPPFDHNGKQAVAAHIYTCKEGTPFVGLLERYTPTGLSQLKAIASSGIASKIADIQDTEFEISKPLAGDKGWIKVNSKAAGAVRAVKCPKGGIAAEVSLPLPPTP